MKINKSLWYIRFYQYLTRTPEEDLPNDICNLRTKLVVTLILFIVSWPIWLIILASSKFTHVRSNITPWAFFYAQFIGWLLGGVLISISFNNYTPVNSFQEISIWFIAPIIISVILLGIVTTFKMLVYLITKIANAVSNVKSQPRESTVKHMYKSWANEYCEKIDWL